MSDTSARFALPFILPGQAQKELFHNEALARVDAALHPLVEAVATMPPGSPAPGQAWLVGTGGEGGWSGNDGRIACWTDGGWRFVAPVDGMLVWDRGAGYWHVRMGGEWSEGALPVSSLRIGGQQVVGPRLPAIAAPAGGGIVDAEARAAVAAIIATLLSHGLTD